MAFTFRMLILPAALVAACASQPGPQAAQPELAPATASTSAPAQPVPAASSATPASPASAASSAPPAAPPPVEGFTPIPPTHKGKFPGFRRPKAKMFDLRPQGPDCPSVVLPDGHLCPRVAEPGAELNATHIERATDLLSDGRAFANAAPKCFEPDHALVFYNDKGAPVGWSLVSLSCGSLTALPELNGVKQTDGKYNVSGPAASYLKGLCKTLKLEACGK